MEPWTSTIRDEVLGGGGGAVVPGACMQPPTPAARRGEARSDVAVTPRQHAHAHLSPLRRNYYD